MGLEIETAIILCDKKHWVAFSWEDLRELLPPDSWVDWVMKFTRKFDCYSDEYVHGFLDDVEHAGGDIMVFGDQTKMVLYKEFLEYMLEEVI